MRTPSGLPSASRLQLAVTCPASQALPIVDSELEAGHEGAELHDLLLRHVLGERSPDELQQEHPWLEAVLETVGDRLRGAAVEVAYGWDTATGEARLFGSRIGRHYPERPASMLVGTVDYVVTEPTQLLAVDLKSGLMEQPPVKRLQQMRFAALAVATWDGFSRPVQTAILHAPRDGRRPWWEWGPRYDSLDLIEVADTFRAMVARIDYARKDVAAGKTPRLTVGSHCNFCPAWRRCPAQVEMVARWANKPAEALRDLEHLMDVETAGRAWEHIEAVEDAIKKAKRQLYAFASVQPFPLPDGRMVGNHQSKGRDDVDAERAWQALVESFGVEVAKASMTLKASRTSIREAVGAVAPRGKKKSAGDAVISALEAAGVITEKWTEDVGPYDPHEVPSAQPALPAAPVEPPATGAPVLSPPGARGGGADDAAKGGTVSEFSKLVGKTIVAIEGAAVGAERVAIVCSDLTRFSLYHPQDCCESVRVEDVTGNPQDLIGHVVALADESTNADNPPEHADSFLWTFYRLRTHGGDVTIRWLGESNGYYGESVECDVDAVPLESLTPEQQVLRDVALERGA